MLLDNSTGNFNTGGVWEPTADNFPSLKHLFTFDEADGATALNDSIGDVVLTDAGITRIDANLIVCGSLSNQVTSGTFDILGTKPFAVLGFGSLELVRIGIINAGNSYVQLNTSAPLVRDGVSGGLATGTDYTIAGEGTFSGRANVISAYNSATGQTTYESSADAETINTLAATSTTAFTSIAPIATGTNGWSPGTSSALSGFVFLEFDAIPSDFAVGLGWMTYQWNLGNKWIYPAWRGIS